jgi:plastocyanin
MMSAFRVALVLIGSLLVVAAPSTMGAEAMLTLEAKAPGTCPAGKSLCFDKSTLSGVNPGDMVTVTMANPTSIPHSVCFTWSSTSQSCTPNSTQGVTNGNHTVAFTAPTAGTYEYFCNVTGHKDAGMTGMLTVQGSASPSPTPTATPTPTPTPTPARGTPALGLVAITLGVAMLAITLRKR